MKTIDNDERIAELERQLEQARASHVRVVQSILTEKQRLQKLCDEQTFEIARLNNELRNREQPPLRLVTGDAG